MTNPTATDAEKRPVEHRQDIAEDQSTKRLQGPPEAAHGAHADDAESVIEQPSIQSIIASLESRSIREKQALLKALLDGGNVVPLAHYGTSTARADVMPLPGLEPPITEKAGLNPTSPKELSQPTGLSPLPGTICSIQNIPKSSTKRRKSATLSLVLSPDVRVGFRQSRSKTGHGTGHRWPDQI